MGHPIAHHSLMSRARIVAILTLTVAPLPAITVQTPSAGFEENKGQFAPEVLYAFRGAGPYLTKNSLELSPDRLSMRFEGGNIAAVVSSLDTLPYAVNVAAWPEALARAGCLPVA